MNYPEYRDDYALSEYQRENSPAATAEELGNVSKACKLMGYHCDTFYEVRRAFQVGGTAALVEEKRGPCNPHPNLVVTDIEQKILDYALTFPRTDNESRMSCASPALR